MHSQLDKLVARLQESSTYVPLMNPFSKVEVRETHISWVFLTPLFAFKLKKAVVFGEILDFSSREKRVQYCLEELRLNQRLAPDLYLGLAWILPTGEIQIEEENQVWEKYPGLSLQPVNYLEKETWKELNAEPLVMMKRFNEELLLANAIERNNLIPRSQIVKLAQLLASFHEQARLTPEYGTLERIRYKWVENFETAQQYISINERFKQDILAFLEREQDLFERRVKSGRIRENHGDIQTYNVVLSESGDPPLVFDALEFNEALRCGDVAEDIAFLTMDLKAKGRYDLSALFLDQYIQESQDEELIDLIPFYEAYRAFVRAKVAAFNASMVSDEEKNKLLETAGQYLKLAEECFYGVSPT